MDDSGNKGDESWSSKCEHDPAVKRGRRSIINVLYEVIGGLCPLEFGIVGVLIFGGLGANLILVVRSRARQPDPQWMQECRNARMQE
jgi:hypothetical protein